MHNLAPGDAPRLATSSTKEEWAETGKKLFDNRRYLQAKHCFLRASLPDRAAAAHAYFLRQEAENTPENKGSERKQAFSNAAEAFLDCTKTARTDDSMYFVLSGRCFLKAGDTLRAAEAFRSGKRYTLSAELYRDLRMFDEAVAIVMTQEVDGEIQESIINRARLFYFSQQKIE